jgi:hypothetical protein
MDNIVAMEILKQLGGNKFLAMTGAKQLTYDNNSLNIKLPKNMSQANYLRITLNSLDTYDIRFYKVSGGKMNMKTFVSSPIINKDIKVLNGVYCDQLQEIFTNVTGMYTSL